MSSKTLLPLSFLLFYTLGAYALATADWHVCGPMGRREGDQITASYSAAQVNRAIRAGYQLHEISNLQPSSNGNFYPQQFHTGRDIPRWVRLLATCRGGAASTLLEYPLVDIGVFGPANQQAGLDRVVFDSGSGAFCGVFTHRGPANNNLFPCFGHNGPVIEPPLPEPQLTNPSMDMPHWLAMFGGRGGNVKRKAVSAPAIPTTIPTATPLPTLSTVIVAREALNAQKAAPLTSSLGPTSFCQYGPDAIAGTKIQYSSGSFYLVCTGAPFPTMGTITSLPSPSVMEKAVMNNPACQTPAPCNTTGCSGWNQAIDSTFGACGSGDCTGFRCTNICPESPFQCNDIQCLGQPDDVGLQTGFYSQGDFQGCDFVVGTYCPSTPPTFNVCLGTSYTNGTGIFRPGPFAACPCKPTCPSTKVSCSADGCGGMNGPHGSDEVCLQPPRLRWHQQRH